MSLKPPPATSLFPTRRASQDRHRRTPWARESSHGPRACVRPGAGHVAGKPAGASGSILGRMDVVIRLASEADWRQLRRVRLQALADSPLAFGTTLGEAEAFPEQRWRDRA